MLLKEVFISLVFLFTLTMAQGQDTCKAKVVVMGREELAEEIKTQITAALPKSGECATYENVTDIVQKETDRLRSKVEKLIEPIAEKLALLEQPGHFPTYPASTCKEILELEPNSPSGYYWLRASNGSERMFCDMTRTCGGVTGGWMKVAELDMTNIAHQCPGSLTDRTEGGKRLCVREVSEAGCSSAYYQTEGIKYSEVCGKVIGYQEGSPNAAYAYRFTNRSIDGPYIDGVSLTHGSSRQHIWSFLNALQRAQEGYDGSACPCTNNTSRGERPPTFVGQDYFCDSGVQQWERIYNQFYDSPLWDGAECGSTNECCTYQYPPWFYKSLGQGTSDDVEMRVCRDEASTNEDVLIEKVDIYVR